MKIFRFIPILFLFLSSITYAQNTTDIEVLYLKNGSIIKGIILQKDTLGNVEIFNAEGLTLSYPYNQVLKIEEYKPPIVVSTEKPIPIIKERKGLFISAKGGILPNGTYSFLGSIGYRFNSQFHLGVGVGYDSYIDIQYGIIPNYSSSIRHTRDGFLPINIESRIFLSREPTSFFIFINGGYSWLVSGGQVYKREVSSSASYQTTNGGIFAMTGVGLKIKVASKTALFFDLGIKIQNYGAKIITAGSNGNQITNSERTSLNPCWGFGVIF